MAAQTPGSLVECCRTGAKGREAVGPQMPGHQREVAWVPLMGLLMPGFSCRDYCVTWGGWKGSHCPDAWVLSQKGTPHPHPNLPVTHPAVGQIPVWPCWGVVGCQWHPVPVLQKERQKDGQTSRNRPPTPPHQHSPLSHRAVREPPPGPPQPISPTSHHVHHLLGAGSAGQGPHGTALGGTGASSGGSFRVWAAPRGITLRSKGKWGPSCLAGSAPLPTTPPPDIPQPLPLLGAATHAPPHSLPNPIQALNPQNSSHP